MTREELIAALETATGADRGLDVDIAFAVHAWPEGVFPMRAIPGQIGLDGGRCVSASPYTASIDAALTLVPAGADWVVRSGMADHPTDTRPYAHVMFGNVNRDRSRSLGEAHAPTPAIALCIAALKAQGGGA
jgi:hypothetical protein